MVIVSASDERFAAHFTALLHSAWARHPEAEFYLLDCGLESHTRATLTDYAATRSMRLSIITVDDARLDELPTTVGGCKAIYARILIPELLPNTIERALYLDADSLVVDDLFELWTTPMDHSAIAAVRDDRAGRHESRSDYVNSGVLLMNLSLWRREHLTAAALTFARGHKLAYPEQTSINAVCAGRIIFLADEWNYMPADMRRAYRGQALHIVHWTVWKPWLYCDAPFGPIYLYHRNQTPFPASAPSAVYRSTLRRLLNLILGKAKYWRLLISAPYARAFADDYLYARAGERASSVVFLHDDHATGSIAPSDDTGGVAVATTANGVGVGRGGAADHDLDILAGAATASTAATVDGTRRAS
jgi:Glycosyl transferase family 8